MNGPAMTDARLDAVLDAYHAPLPSAGFAARVAAAAARPDRVHTPDRRTRRRPWARRGIVAGVLLANLLAVSAIAAVLQGHPFGLTRIASLAHQLFARPAATRMLHHPAHGVAAHRAPAAALATLPTPPAGQPVAVAPALPMPLSMPRYVQAPIAADAVQPSAIRLLPRAVPAQAKRRPAREQADGQHAEAYRERRARRVWREHGDLARQAAPAPSVASRETLALERPDDIARSEPVRDEPRAGAEGASRSDLQSARATRRERWAAWRRGDGWHGRELAPNNTASQPDKGAHPGERAAPGEPELRQHQRGMGRPGMGQPGAGQHRQGGGGRRLFGGRGGRPW